MKTIINLKDNIDLYLKSKNRKGEVLSNEETFFILDETKKFFEENKFDYIFIPESKSGFLEKIAKEYCYNVITIYKKVFDTEDILSLMIDIKYKDIEEEQKKSIIFKLLELVNENKKSNDDLVELYHEEIELKLSIHNFKSSQRKHIIEYIYNENSIQSIINLIHFNKEKSFCILDDFVNSGETINFLKDKIDSFADSINLELVSIFKQEK